MLTKLGKQKDLDKLGTGLGCAAAAFFGTLWLVGFVCVVAFWVAVGAIALDAFNVINVVDFV